MKSAKGHCDKCPSTNRLRRFLGGPRVCDKHYYQLRTYGKVIRIRYDKNEVTCNAYYCEMKLYDKNDTVVATTLFDKKFLNDVTKYKWCLKQGKYAVAWVNKKLVFLHHFVFQRSSKFETDHRNGGSGLFCLARSYGRRADWSK
jgi:hypothetical protein